jgi:anionic cell wall polymer biosynthesis LytR-Cps2A-Psr (LCP) family protein
MQIINENGLHELKKVVDKLQGIRINNRNEAYDSSAEIFDTNHGLKHMNASEEELRALFANI